jgi:lysophospholipid acyltransferase (LPLAT)-like uncharacterized protein
MKLRSQPLIRLAALLGSWLIRLWMGTIRFRLHSMDGISHPADPSVSRFIYTFWHEGLLFPAALKARACTLISKSADGELIARVCMHLGIRTVRGSASDGGIDALMGLRQQSGRRHLVVTPDGPRGPRRRLKVGVIFIASCTDLPIVPCGLTYSRAWRMRSWDRFALPKPWSTCYCVAMPAIRVPRRVNRASLEFYRQLVEEQMRWATEAAEHWAALGTRQMPLPPVPQPAPMASA